ncbi:copper radical oxidase [Macrolepiota fuliginosa MF-IS2]|uniref:Copper radical oxidase n=1 Tax=Macrolepiota fuliginosa MF-IS2 TaxID=1400762 RepID=A0A9P5XCZ9_9AGAR|nr:copper radical oxidase [Macrolepiota fuliginosa MF-IS2]
MSRNSIFSKLLAFTLIARLAAATGTGWHFVQNGTSGIVALESVIMSDNLAILFDRATNDPLQIDGHTAWGAFWNLETNTATPLRLVSDTLCSSGGFLSNGTLISVGGIAPSIPWVESGLQAIRVMEPCDDPNGVGCSMLDDPENFHLATTRWYPSSLRIFDGSLMIVGGMHEQTPFYNTDPVNSLEFFPSKDGGVPRPLDVLARAGPVNTFPRTIGLPDGRVFMAVGNQTIIYDIEANTETRLPNIPNGVRVTNPLDGAVVLLPLHPPDYTPEVLICGGSTTSDQIPSENLSTQTPATDQCSRMTLTQEGIQRGWQIERMLEPRIMPEIVLMPNGQGVIINGAQTGYASMSSVGDPIGGSNADHPAFTPSLYTPDAPLGQRISNREMPTTDIPRMYHSTATLTPQGNILVGGSNPNPTIVNGTTYPSEFRIEYLNPPSMTSDRPQLSNVPKQIAYNAEFDVNVTIPKNLNPNNIKVALMDLGFSTHAFHQSQLLVFMEGNLKDNNRRLTIKTPPNNRVYPPGPAWIYLTVDDVSSVGVRVMVGNGAPPPVPDQGVSH